MDHIHRVIFLIVIKLAYFIITTTDAHDFDLMKTVFISSVTMNITVIRDVKL
jgi:hypothetical protein